MADTPESALDYPWGDTLPAAGSTLELRPGVRWLRMSLPFALNHINLWLLRDRQDGVDGWTIVDCGINDDTTRAAWEQIFASPELRGLPVLRVVCTHMHPDHIGLAHWLCEHFSCRLWISSTDWNVARLASQSTTGFGGEASAQFFALHGLTDPDALAQVLEPEADPLRLYLASIERFRDLPADTLVLPSHGKPFTGLQVRIDQLHQHHDDRLAETLAACTERPHSAADLLPVLFKRALDLHQTTFAMGESLAHLHKLLYQGRLRLAPTADGVRRFSAVEERCPGTQAANMKKRQAGVAPRLPPVQRASQPEPLPQPGS